MILNVKRRLILFPITLFVILTVNFVVLHLVKKPHFYLSLNSNQFETLSQPKVEASRPILINLWPFARLSTIEKMVKEKDARLLSLAPYIQSQLYALLENEKDHALAPLISAPKHTIFQKCQVMFCQTELFSYLGKIFKLDFGFSQSNPHIKVENLIFSHLWRSLTFLILPFVGIFVMSQVLGLMMALWQGRAFDKILGALMVSLYAIPLYIMIPLLIEKVGLKFHLPIHGFDPSSPINWLLPTLAMSYGALAIYSRIHRSLFLQLLGEEHLRCSKARGLSSWRIIFVHTFRQSIISSVVLFLGSLNFFMSSLIILETLFEIDGFGRLFYQSLIVKDTDVILLSIIVLSMLSMVGYLLSDLFLYYFDPRIKHHEHERVY